MSADPLIGTQLAAFRIRALIGSGGMGRVYAAEHARGGWPVAVKILDERYAADETFRARFLDEARIAKSIDHPGIVTIHDVGEDRGLLYIAMDLVKGGDLRDLLARSPVSPADALDLLDPVAGALDAAHARGLIHRDVKPGNILIGQSRTYLSDFGIAKATADGPDPESFIGTVEYAAPEQIAGQALDGRCDVYGLGCVLYECLTGEPPFSGAPEDVLKAHREVQPPPISSRRTDLPRAMDDVLSRALAKSRDARPGSCTSLVESARSALGQAGATASPTVALPPTQPEPAPPPEPVKRSPIGRILLAALFVAIAAAGIAIALSPGDGGKPPVTETEGETDPPEDPPPEDPPPEDPPPEDPPPEDPPPEDPPPEDPPPEDLAREALNASIPDPVLERGCGEVEPLPGATLAYQCQLGGASWLEYHSYGTPEGMDNHFDDRAQITGADQNAGCDPDQGINSGTDTWDGGRYMCYQLDGGQSWIEWTENDESVYGLIGRNDTNLSALYQAWRDGA